MLKPRIPDASIDPKFLADDIDQLAKIGAGGTEIHNYFGTPTGEPPTNWSIYGYGTDKYVKVLKAGLQAHADNGLIMDYAISNNGAVPAATDNPGLTWELLPRRSEFNDSYSGTLPGVKPAPIDNALHYVIQGWYENQPLSGEIVAASDDPQNILEGGSLYVDHFSATGGKVSTDFLEEYVLADGVRELLQEVGHFLWEDSVEIPATTFWTPDLDKVFEKQHGYSLTSFFPLLEEAGGYQADSPRVEFVADTGDRGAGFVADFRSTLTSLLQVYYESIINWSHDYVGLEFSGQIGYNLPVDMLHAIPVADAPETETLSFGNYLDGFLRYSGPADLSEKQIFSIELGADYLLPFSQTFHRLLFDAKHAFAGGVNQVVIHGATYSHNFTETTWPGYTTHDYDYPEHSRHQPGWGVGFPEALGYLARVQWVLQRGVPKVDIAFWNKQSAQNAFPSPLHTPTDLVEAGYTYEYLSPANFGLKEAYVKDGILAPKRQAFRALILRGNDNLTPNGVDYLVKYAKAGLHIIISGGLPSAFATANKTAIAAANAKLAGMLDFDNVHEASYEGLAAKVASIGITPRSTIDSNGAWYTRWRETSDADYIFIFNDGNYSIGNISFDNPGTPYYLNAWTGEGSRLAKYTRNHSHTTIAFALEPTESRIVKFVKSDTLDPHVISSSKGVLGFDVIKGSSIRAKMAASNGSSISLSSGKTVGVGPVRATPAYSLANWNLTVEQWLPPDDMNNLDLDAKKINQTVGLTEPSLLSWYDLGLQEISGIGYYTSSFEWSLSSTRRKSGAFLALPAISHGIVGTLNGKSLPSFDITNPRVDISSYLIPGTNSLALKVSSTLWNGLSPYWNDLKTAGGVPGHEHNKLGPLQDYGIIGEVKIVPYELVELA